MKKIILIVLMSIFIFGIVSAEGIGQVCIDKTAPDAPLDLGVSGNSGSILLTWSEVIDKPSCSRIDYYNISRGGKWIGQVGWKEFSFVDNESLGEGEYSYTVYAVDLVGGNAGNAIKNVIKIDQGGGSRGGSSSYSYVCVEDWECGEWSECLGNDMRRLCEDLNECGTEKDKPEVYQECGVSEDGDVIVEDEGADVGEPNRFFSAITGAVIGGGAKSVAVAGGFLVLAVGGLFIVIRKRKKKR